MQIIENRLPDPRDIEDCEFLQRVTDEVDTNVPEITENVTYHDCMVLISMKQCAYPARCIYPSRYCEFKKESEDLVEWVQSFIRGET